MNAVINKKTMRLFKKKKNKKLTKKEATELFRVGVKAELENLKKFTENKKK